MPAERLYVKPPSFYDDPDIELHPGTTVTRIDLAGKIVTDADSNAYRVFSVRTPPTRCQFDAIDRTAGFSGSTALEWVDLTDGKSVAADCVRIAIRIVPNVELAEDAGVDVDNGIRVDDRCRTSDDSVHAIGDCANHPNNLLGQRLRLESVYNALEQAKIAAHDICGTDS